MVSAISSKRAVSAAPMSRRYLARMSTGVVDHVAKARLAAATAVSTSAAVPSATLAMTSSVAESVTSTWLSPLDGTQAPSM